jgi:hypothetical protein
VFLALAVLCLAAFLASLFMPATTLAETFDEDEHPIGGVDLVAPV